jgi:xyloglucan fucosyltransferase
VRKQLDDPAAAEPWSPVRDEKKMWRRVLLVGSLVTLPLLAFFVLGRERTTAWLQMAIAKLTAMNDGTAGTVLLRVC